MKERQYRASFGYPEGKVKVLYFYAESMALAKDHAWVVANHESDEEGCTVFVLKVRRLDKDEEIPNEQCGELNDYDGN